ncbi:MAG: glycosyltransferase family 2 protein [Flavobacterium sp.]
MLAVIIPYYKLTFFEAALQSLAAQTDKRFKVYIGDDASPEDCSSLLKKFEGQFDFVYHRFESNLGGASLTKQWERCIVLSGNEDWLMFFGDDDVLGENVVEEFYKNLEAITPLKIPVVRFATQIINDLNYPDSGIYHHPKIETATDFLFRNTRSSLSEYIFLKENIMKIGFRNFPLAWYSDLLAVLEFSNFKEVYTINESIVNIRVSSLSISGNADFLKDKNQSKFDFYYYLLSKKRKFFSGDKQKELFARISKCYINEKKQFRYFFKISWLYLKFFNGIGFLGFIKSIIFYTFQKR